MARPSLSLFLALVVSLYVSQGSESKKLPPKPPFRIFPGRLLLQTDFYQECDNVSGLALQTTNTHVKTIDNNQVVIDADYLCTRIIPSLTKAVISIFNCPDRASGSCQLYQTWRYGRGDSCALFMMKNQFWSSFLESCTPRFACPNTQPGRYELRNGTLDVRILEAIPFPWEKYYWRIRMELYDPSLIHCITAGGQFLRSRT